MYFAMRATFVRAESTSRSVRDGRACALRGTAEDPGAPADMAAEGSDSSRGSTASTSARRAARWKSSASDVTSAISSATEAESQRRNGAIAAAAAWSAARIAARRVDGSRGPGTTTERTRRDARRRRGIEGGAGCRESGARGPIEGAAPDHGDTPTGQRGHPHRTKGTRRDRG